MQESLRCAEEAAAVATSECAGLVQVVQTLINQEARVRSSQAHRAHELREALQQTHAALRRAADKDRGTQDEVGGAAWQMAEPGTGVVCMGTKAHLQMVVQLL
jgi:hypothetical protein